VLMGNDA